MPRELQFQQPRLPLPDASAFSDPPTFDFFTTCSSSSSSSSCLFLFSALRSSLARFRAALAAAACSDLRRSSTTLSCSSACASCSSISSILLSSSSSAALLAAASAFLFASSMRMSVADGCMLWSVGGRKKIFPPVTSPPNFNQHVICFPWASRFSPKGEILSYTIFSPSSFRVLLRSPTSSPTILLHYHSYSTSFNSYLHVFPPTSPTYTSDPLPVTSTTYHSHHLLSYPRRTHDLLMTSALALPHTTFSLCLSL